MRDVHCGEDSVNIAVVVVERESDAELLVDFFPGRFAVLAPIAKANSRADSVNVARSNTSS
jgi:hypothetical protein